MTKDKMTKEAASRIQSAADRDKSGRLEGFKERAQAAAEKNEKQSE